MLNIFYIIFIFCILLFYSNNLQYWKKCSIIFKYKCNVAGIYILNIIDGIKKKI